MSALPSAPLPGTHTIHMPVMVTAGRVTGRIPQAGIMAPSSQQRPRRGPGSRRGSPGAARPKLAQNQPPHRRRGAGAGRGCPCARGRRNPTGSEARSAAALEPAGAGLRFPSQLWAGGRSDPGSGRPAPSPAGTCARRRPGSPGLFSRGTGRVPPARAAPSCQEPGALPAALSGRGPLGGPGPGGT